MRSALLHEGANRDWKDDIGKYVIAHALEDVGRQLINPRQ